MFPSAAERNRRKQAQEKEKGYPLKQKPYSENIKYLLNLGLVSKDSSYSLITTESYMGLRPFFVHQAFFFYICARNKAPKTILMDSIGPSALQNDSGNKKRQNHGKITLSEDF
jgi:hypothetical protein